MGIKNKKLVHLGIKESEKEIFSSNIENVNKNNDVRNIGQKILSILKNVFVS